MCFANLVVLPKESINQSFFQCALLPTIADPKRMWFYSTKKGFEKHQGLQYGSAFSLNEVFGGMPSGDPIYRLLHMLSNLPILTLRSRGSSHRSHWRPAGRDTNETSHSVRLISCAGNVVYTSVAEANRLARRCCYLCLVSIVRSSDVCFQLNVYCCQLLFFQLGICGRLFGGTNASGNLALWTFVLRLKPFGLALQG